MQGAVAVEAGQQGQHTLASCAGRSSPSRSGCECHIPSVSGRECHIPSTPTESLRIALSRSQRVGGARARPGVLAQCGGESGCQLWDRLRSMRRAVMESVLARPCAARRLGSPFRQASLPDGSRLMRPAQGGGRCVCGGRSVQGLWRVSFCQHRLQPQ